LEVIQNWNIAQREKSVEVKYEARSWSDEGFPEVLEHRVS